ncbi:MAG: protein kinase [bacterium]|nr:protein kinase [bacterium]
MPTGNENESQLVQEILAQYLARVDAGEAVDFDEFCASHPDLAGDLVDLKENWIQVQGVLAKLGVVGSSSKTLSALHDKDIDPMISLEPEGQADPDFASEVIGRLAGRSGSFGRYRIKGEVARGGQGVVLRIWDDDLRRNLAMKVILGEGDAAKTGATPTVDGRKLSRFVEEAQITGQLDHPGIVPVHELGLDSEGRVYFTMKLVKGKTLQTVLDELAAGEGGWTQTRVLGVLLKVCEAMSYAHAKGVVHRDLKPSNVMVGRFGEVHVMDWGLARVLGREDGKDIRIRPPLGTSEVRSPRREASGPDSPLVTMNGDVVGTPAYMPPEQAFGKLDAIGPPSDVYALGAMLYHLLAGHMPYVKPGMRLTNHAIWYQVQDGAPHPLSERAPDAPAELVAICERAMERDAGRRYGDTIELAKDLSAYLEDRVVWAYQSGAVAELRKWVRRNRALAAAVLLVLGLSVLGSVVLAGNNRKLTRANREVTEQRNLSALNTYAAQLGAAQNALNTGAIAAAERHLKETPERMRGWEWRYLNALCDQSIGKDDIGKGGLQDVAWLSNKQLLVVPIGPEGIHVWDLDTKSIVRSLRGFDARNARVALTPDLKWVITGSERGIERWSLSTCERHALLADSGRVRNMSLSRDGTHLAWIVEDDRCGEVWIMELSGTKGPRALFDPRQSETAYTRVQFTADGKSLLVASYDGEGASIAVVDLASNKVSDTFNVDTLPVDVIELEAVSTRLYTGGLSDRIRQWSSNGKLLREYECPDRVLDLFPTSDGHLYAAGGWFAGWVHRLDTATFKRVGRFNGHRQGVNACALAPAGHQFATVSRDGTLRTWSLDPRPPFQTIYSGRPARQLSQTRDGKQFATVSTVGEWQVWDADELDVIGRGGMKLEGVGYSGLKPGFRGCAVEGEVIYTFGDVLRAYDVATGNELFAMRIPDDARKVNHGVMDVVVEADDTLIGRTYDGRLIRFDPRTDPEGRFVDLDPPFLVNSLRWEPGHERLVAGCKDGFVRFLQPETLTVLEPSLETTPGIPVNRTAPHGDRIAVSNDDGTVRVFDRADGGSPVLCQGPDGDGMSLAFSPDGSRLVTGDGDRTVRIWDPSTGKELLSLETPDSAGDVFFSNDGRRLFVRSQAWYYSNASILVFEIPDR